MTRFRKLVPFLIIAILLSIPGCAKTNQEPAKKQLTQQKPAPPAQMKSMLFEEQTLLENLQQQAKKEKLAAKEAAAKAKMKAEAAALAKKAQMEALAKQKAEQEAQQKAQQGAQTPSQQPTTPTPPSSVTPQTPSDQSQAQTTPTVQVIAQGSQDMAFWQQTTQLVKKISQDWNALEPQATKAGLTTTQRDNIKKALDSLITAGGAQDTEKSMLAAIELFGQSESLAKVFMSPVPPEYFQLNYEIMMSAMEADKLQWTAAAARIPKMESTWSTVKAAFKGKNASLVNQTQLSIRDYETAIRNRQADVVSIKAETALQNLKAVEEALTAMAAAAKTGS